MSGAKQHVLVHSVACQGACVASTDQNPGCLARGNLVASRHGELHILRKVREVLDGLLYGVHTEALDGEVAVRVGAPEEPMLEHDGRSIQLLGDAPVYRRVGQVRGVG